MEFVKISNVIYSATPPERPNHHKFFTNGQLGVNLGRVMHGDIVIDDPWVPFLEERRQKVAVRILVDHHAEFTKVKNIQGRVKGRNVPRMRQNIVADVAKVVQEFIEHESLLAAQPEPWIFGPGHIQLDDIWMSELLHVSTGSYQAILWVGTSRPQAPPPSPDTLESSAVSPIDRFIDELATIDALLADLAADVLLFANMTPPPLSQPLDGADDPFDFGQFDWQL